MDDPSLPLTQSPLFHEEQKFRQAWIWIGLGFAFFGLLPMWYGVYQQIVEGRPWGNNPSSDQELFLITSGMTLFILGIGTLLIKSRLVVTIGSVGIVYRFIPFHLKVHMILWRDVQKAVLRTYKPILEYGGWGIRFGRSGKAYNVQGTTGLQLELKSGKRVLFGTQKPEELVALLKEIPLG